MTIPMKREPGGGAHAYTKGPLTIAALDAMWECGAGSQPDAEGKFMDLRAPCHPNAPAYVVYIPSAQLVGFLCAECKEAYATLRPADGSPDDLNIRVTVTPPTEGD